MTNLQRNSDQTDASKVHLRLEISVLILFWAELHELVMKAASQCGTKDSKFLAS